MYHLTRGGEKIPPYRAAIPEYPGLLQHHNGTIQQAQYRLLLDLSNCTSLQCLRRLSYTQLASITQQSYFEGYSNGIYGLGDYWYTPVVDGTFVQGLPSKKFAKGRFSKVPLLVDHDAFEGIGFTNASVTSASEIQRDLQPFWQAATPQFLKTLYRLYPKTDYEGSYSLDNNLFLRPIFTAIATMFGLNEQDTAYWQLQAISGDYVIKCPTRYVSGSAAKTQIPIWKLIFNRGYFAHGAIAPYILGAPSAPLQFNNTLAVIMEDCWLSSIINLDPNSLLPTINSTNQPKWPRYGADATIIQVNETSIQPMTDSDASEQCDFCQQTLRMSETR